MSDEQFIQTKLNIPNHINELKAANKLIDELKFKLNALVIHNKLNGQTHKLLYEEIVQVLDFIGRLSMPAFEYETKLEEMYYTKYHNTPQLAKHLWLKHYEKIHHPYNIHKNRCFRLLDDLDDVYMKKFNTKPPNWKI